MNQLTTAHDGSDIHKGAQLRNRRNGEDCVVVGGPDSQGRWPVMYDETPEDGVYWMRPERFESRDAVVSLEWPA